jgi:hypothetical protein
MTPEIISVITLFAPAFTSPTWKKAQILFIGAILCRGARRITSILRVMNLSGERNFSKYHRFLSHAKWSGLVLSKILFGMLVNLLPTTWPILIAVDETLERRRGKKIKAKGVYRDAVLSSESKVITSFGLKWECMTLIVPLPWCKRPWALPFLTVLAPSKQCNEKANKRHKTSIDWTQQMVKLVARWAKRPWVLLGDGAYACMKLARTCIKHQVTLVSRFRLDAQLFELPKLGRKKLGRKPIKGKRIFLKKLLENNRKSWETMEVNWYGGKKKSIEYLTFECLWYHAGIPPLPVRIVLVKTPDGKNVAETFFSTNTTDSPEQIINWFVLRWNIEVTFEETRAHLGIETQRQWSDKGIQRSTPLLMGLYSLATLIGLKIHEKEPIFAQEKTSWYDKNGELTFSDIITAVRTSILTKKYFSKSGNECDLLKITASQANALIYQLALAA